MGIEWKRAIDKTNEWAAWWWASVKIDKKSLALLKHTTNILKEDTKNYNWVKFTHAMDFFKDHESLKKPILKHFFISLFNDLSIKNLVIVGNLLSIEFMKPQRRLYVILSKQTYVPLEFKNKVLKHSMNHRMIGPAPKQWDLYNSQKQWHINKWRRN
jgi:hypothetical protein